ncbi:MAG: hypothetical protein Q7S07_03625 [Candidatus Omnitrophota bacterium]|nr:hypothetical protein [Candidatus Omnitrophota bacterium]
MKRPCFTLTLFALAIAGSAIAPYSPAEQFQYESRGKRDPMIPLIGREKPSGAVQFSEIATAGDVSLEGIVASTSGSSMAIINGELVKEGFRAGEVEIKKITKNSVTLAISGKEYTIPLPEQGGQKE